MIWVERPVQLWGGKVGELDGMYVAGEIEGDELGLDDLGENDGNLVGPGTGEVLGRYVG